MSLNYVIDNRSLRIVQLLVGTGVMLAGLEINGKLTAIRASAFHIMPYVAGMPGLNGLHPAIPLLFVPAGALIAAGRSGRSFMAVVVAGLLLILLGDQRTYSNHLYFLALIVFLLAFIPSPNARDEVAGWPVVLLKYQLSLLYGFGALSKITPLYLSGCMLAGNLDRQLWNFPPWDTARSVYIGVAVLSILVEAVLAVALWSRRYCRAAMALGLMLHVGCAVLLQNVRIELLVFGCTSVAIYPLFLASPVGCRDNGMNQRFWVSARRYFPTTT